ncbi:MAG: DNA-invertase hin [Dehalococcoidia bacterium]|nr:DNA-invertase hin [Bacillota bacterium]
MIVIKVGYARVSTEDQALERQTKALLDAGTERIFEEKISGKNISNRPELKAMLEYLRDGDVLYIESISRLSRDLRDLLNIVDALSKKNIGLISLKESHIDTTSPQGKLIFHIFASLSQFERESIRQNQMEGIAIAKANGKYRGRKKIAIERNAFRKTYDEWQAKKITATKAMQMLGIKRNTFYRRVGEFEREKA